MVPLGVVALRPQAIRLANTPLTMPLLLALPAVVGTSGPRGLELPMAMQWVELFLLLELSLLL